MPELNPTQIRVVVFKDEKGIKQPIFDSQQFSSEEGEVSSNIFFCGESVNDFFVPWYKMWLIESINFCGFNFCYMKS